MQVQITLSNKEKRHYFLYLLGLLSLIVGVLSFIFLHQIDTPFSHNNLTKIQTLQEQAKFNQQQTIAQPIVDSAFSKIHRYDVNQSNPIEEQEIKLSINDIANLFQNASITDPRKITYVKIANFYQMYYEDKNIISKKNENINILNDKIEECMIGYKDKRSQANEISNIILNNRLNK